MVKQLKEVGWSFLLLGVIVVFTWVLPYFLGLAGTGFESSEIIQFQNFYTTPIAFVIGLLLFISFQVYISYKDKKYGDSIAFNDKGSYPSLKFFKRFTNLQLALYSLVIFLTLFLVITKTTTQTAFSDVLVLPQQFTPGQSVLYSTFLVAGAENVGAAIVIAFLLVVIGLLARKYNWDSITFKVSYYSTAILIGLYGLGNHLLRYGGNDIAKTAVFFFWTFGAALTLISGSFIPFWILHIVNNSMFDITRLFSSDTAVIYFIVVIIVLITLIVFIYKGRYLGQKNVQQVG